MRTKKKKLIHVYGLYVVHHCSIFQIEFVLPVESILKLTLQKETSTAFLRFNLPVFVT